MAAVTFLGAVYYLDFPSFPSYLTEEFAAKEEAGERERFFKSIDGYVWLKQQGIIAKKQTGELAERLLHQS